MTAQHRHYFVYQSNPCFRAVVHLHQDHWIQDYAFPRNQIPRIHVFMETNDLVEETTTMGHTVTTLMEFHLVITTIVDSAACNSISLINQ